jgi:hypothetical protein
MVFKIGHFAKHSELLPVFENLDLRNYHNGRQIAITCRESCTNEEAWTDGLNVNGEYLYDKWAAKELEYSYLSPHFQFPVVKQLIGYLKTLTPFKIGRIRLMRLTAASCYSLHTDLDLRLQIPIITNPECLLILAKDNIFQLPANGDIFILDGRHPHTAINGSMKGHDRIHIVCSLVAESPEHYSKFLNGSNLPLAPYPKNLAKVYSPTAKRIFQET